MSNPNPFAPAGDPTNSADFPSAQQAADAMGLKSDPVEVREKDAVASMPESDPTQHVDTRAPSPSPFPKPADTPLYAPTHQNKEVSIHDLAKQMEEGQFTSFAVVACNAEGAVLMCRAKGQRPMSYAVVGALEIMKSAIVKNEADVSSGF